MLMRLLGRKKKKEPTPAPYPTFARILNVAIVIAVIYMVAGGFKAGMKGEQQPDAAHPNMPAQEALLTGEGRLHARYYEAAEINAMERLSMIGQREIVHESKEGTGAPLICGQTLRYKLAVTNYPARKPDPGFASISNKTASMRLGEALTPAQQILHLMATGLTTNGSSEYAFPRNLAIAAMLPKGNKLTEGDPARPVILRMEVQGATPPLPVEGENAALTILETARGEIHRISCGSQARVQLHAWDMEGNPVKFTRTDGAVTTEDDGALFTATLGMGQLPLGIERAADGMGVGGTRMVILPPAYQTPFPTASKTLPVLTLPQMDRVLLVQVDLRESEKPAPVTLAPAPASETPQPDHAEPALDKPAVPENNPAVSAPVESPPVEAIPAVAEPAETSTTPAQN